MPRLLRVVLRVRGLDYLRPHLLLDAEEGRLQDDVDLMMSHINSYVREASGDKPPYDLMTRKFGVEFADLFNVRRIPANDVVLKPSLLGIEQKVRPEIIKATNPKNNTK